MEPVRPGIVDGSPAALPETGGISGMENALSERLGGFFAILWAGMVLGGSLIAAPAKFQAPSLAMPVALEVGRAQFLWIGRAETVCAVILAAILALSLLRQVRQGWWQGIWQGPVSLLLSGAILLFLLQRLVLMPSLNLRTDAVIAGDALSPGSLHLVFIFLEVIRFCVLLIAGWCAIQKDASYVTR